LLFTTSFDCKRFLIFSNNYFVFLSSEAFISTQLKLAKRAIVLQRVVLPQPGWPDKNKTLLVNYSGVIVET